MKKSNVSSGNKFVSSGNKLEDFLKDFMIQVNTGIHEDLESSSDYLERNELKDYVEPKGLNIAAIEKDEDNLTVRDVLEIGIHWARHATHRNWHEAMDAIAEKHGVEKLDLHDEDNQLKDIDKKIEDLFDGKVTLKAIAPKDLPPEIREILEGIVETIQENRKKRGGKKK
jgi:nitrogen-specific signal transduction histidine kinase